MIIAPDTAVFYDFYEASRIRHSLKGSKRNLLGVTNHIPQTWHTLRMQGSGLANSYPLTATLRP